MHSIVLTIVLVLKCRRELLMNAAVDLLYYCLYIFMRDVGGMCLITVFLSLLKAKKINQLIFL